MASLAAAASASASSAASAMLLCGAVGVIAVLVSAGCSVVGPALAGATAGACGWLGSASSVVMAGCVPPGNFLLLVKMLVPHVLHGKEWIDEGHLGA